MALVVAIGAVAAVPSTAGRLDGTIAYGILDADGSVYTVRPDGTGSRKVLTDAQWIELSRDGRQLAYARSYGNRGLWTADVDGTDRRRLVNPATREIQGQSHYQTWEPTWSPDGKRIAFAALWEVPLRDGLDIRTEERVVTVEVSGGALRVLADGTAPAWSPKGDLIAYTTDVGGTGYDNWNRVAVMRSDGTARRFVVRDRNAWRTELDFSPSGRKLLYLERDFERDRSRLRILDLRTGRRTTVTTQPGQSAVWAPSAGGLPTFTTRLHRPASACHRPRFT
jgi:Tol biopolymer transport system component